MAKGEEQAAFKVAVFDDNGRVVLGVAKDSAEEGGWASKHRQQETKGETFGLVRLTQHLQAAAAAKGAVSRRIQLWKRLCVPPTHLQMYILFFFTAAEVRSKATHHGDAGPSVNRAFSKKLDMV
jgi:hypothetical protein